MQSRYSFHLPTRVEFGNGIAARTGHFLKELGIGRVLIVTDPGIAATPILAGVTSSMIESGIEYEIFREVVPNPHDGTVAAALVCLNDFKADGVVAIGGGSSIDTAKAVAAIATNTGNILDFEGVGKLANPTLPLVAIPTNAGTGSEVTASTVITNRETKFKTAIISPFLFPGLAIVDPMLTVSVPPAITAATGMDALTHAIESYVSKHASPLSEAFALHAMKLIGESIRKAYFIGTDLVAREKMMIASLMAGAAFAHSRLGNVHAMSHTLGGVFDIAHGIANACLLPYVMQFNLPACTEKMRDIAAALGRDIAGVSLRDGAQQAVAAVAELNRDLHIPDNIRELGVDLQFLPKLVADSMRSGNVLVNPRMTTAADIEMIFQAAYNGEFPN